MLAKIVPSIIFIGSPTTISIMVAQQHITSISQQLIGHTFFTIKEFIIGTVM